jgi:hypothetical protein
VPSPLPEIAIRISRWPDTAFFGFRPFAGCEAPPLPAWGWLLRSASIRLTTLPVCRPNVFRCHFIIRIGNYDRARVDIPIRDRDDNPIWLVHPLQDRRPVDIVAIPLATDELRGSVALLPVNDLASGKLAIMVGMEVFILGYPFGSAPPAFPVWKRGSIASEPDLVKLTTRYYLVDTASRPGMSGSPVILRSRNNHVLESSNWIVTDDSKPIDRIIGIYSGRTDDLPGEAQIGMVWHADYIDEIIDHGKLDV